MPDTPYTPIDCGFYDILEDQAVRGVPCEIVYLDPEENQRVVETRILDVYARGNEEFIVLAATADDPPIRLDRLVRVAGVDRPASCAPSP
ncbi:MAG: hypothetical protein R2834_22855 [Rhodothermales bacterium]